MYGEESSFSGSTGWQGGYARGIEYATYSWKLRNYLLIQKQVQLSSHLYLILFDICIAKAFSNNTRNEASAGYRMHSNNCARNLHFLVPANYQLQPKHACIAKQHSPYRIGTTPTARSSRPRGG